MKRNIYYIIFIWDNGKNSAIYVKRMCYGNIIIIVARG